MESVSGGANERADSSHSEIQENLRFPQFFFSGLRFRVVGRKGAVEEDRVAAQLLLLFLSGSG